VILNSKMRFDSDGHSQQHLSPSRLKQLPLPKFKTTYADIEDRRKRTYVLSQSLNIRRRLGWHERFTTKSKEKKR
jgi:hypothetical protein